MINNFTALGVLKLVHIYNNFASTSLINTWCTRHQYIMINNINYCKYIRVHEHFCSNLDIPFLLKFTTKFLINR